MKGSPLTATEARILVKLDGAIHEDLVARFGLTHAEVFAWSKLVASAKKHLAARRLTP